MIACYALEVLIRKLAAAYGTPDLASNDKLKTVINQMPNYGGVDGLRKDRWRWLKEIRNNLFHRGRIPTVMETEQLIKEVLRLEEDLKSAIAKME